MLKSKKIFALVTALLVIGIMMVPVICGADAGAEEPASKMFATFWALVPPVVAIGLALITKEVYSSLFVGIVIGGLFATNFSPIKTVDAVVNDGLIGAVSDLAGIFLFLVLLGVLVALINKSGGSQAFGEWAKTHIKSRTGAMLATFVLGVLIFIDDYFNCLTVGTVMKPVTDAHKISRAKLAYIIDATAAPICMIAPISSWAAAVSEFAPEGQGLSLFVKAIPYNFYSLLTLVFVVAIALMKLDYGPMKLHEKNALLNGDLFTTGERVEEMEAEAHAKGKVIDLVLPVIILIIVCIFALIYVGHFFGYYSYNDLDISDYSSYYHNFANAFSATNATLALPWGGLIVVVLTMIYMIARRLMTFKEAMDCVPKGFIAMVPAITILTMATGLKNMTGLLGADVYVEGIMNGAAAGLANFLPAIIFLVACFLAFSTGTSWGTFGILIPIVVAVFPEGSELLIIGMSACLAGAVCGDHCSPISDTTIMSSAGAACNHVNHVSTQLPYAITVAAISFVMYLLAGAVQFISLPFSSAFILLPVGIALTIGTLFVIKAITSKQ